MFQTCLARLAVMLRGVQPRRNLVFGAAKPILLMPGLTRRSQKKLNTAMGQTTARTAARGRSS